MSLTDRLKSLDTHSSVSREFRVYTLQGAIFSLITIIAIIYLVSTEFLYNFQPSLIERVHVNATSPAGIEMEFDITLNNVPCARLSIDASDPNGQAQSLHLDRQHHVWKHRIRYTAEGKGDSSNSKQNMVFIGDRTKLELGSTLLEEEHLVSELSNETNKKPSPMEAADYCGSCFGAGEEGECCNTCDDVKRAYSRKSWLLKDLENIEQCEAEMEQQEMEVHEGEGCNIHGVVALSSGGGNLHLAPGRGQQSGKGGDKDKDKKANVIDEMTHLSLVDLVLRTFEQWNVSHTIHKLRFGEEFTGQVHQLDGEQRIIEDTYGMYQYYFQVVPTLYKFLNGTTIQTNQYSVTEHLRHVNPGSGRGLPGVFFFYEVSPLHVEISEVYRKGWVAFFTSVCAVVGGVVSVMGMLDQFFFNYNKSNKGRGQTLAR